MKAILAVDLEEALTAGLAAALDRRGLGARVQAVPWQRAAYTAAHERFDLVVLDLADRPAPPPGLLPALAEVSPGACLVALAGSAVAQAPNRPASFDGVEVLDRELPPEDLSTRIAAALQRGVKGHLENVGLAAFIQLVAVEKESCTLAVRSAGRTGTISFVRGDLWDARVGATHGDEAVIEIFGWETADIDMSAGGQKPQRTINASLTYLLIEAMRRRDEQVRDAPAAAVPPPADGGAAGRRDNRAKAAAAANPARTLIDGLTREVEGCIAVCLVEIATGRRIEAQSMRPGLDLDLAGDFGRESLEQVQALTGALGLASPMEDLLFTTSDEVHLLKSSAIGVFLYLAADRAHAGYPQLRAALQKLWPAFESDARSHGLGRQADTPAASGKALSHARGC